MTFTKSFSLGQDQLDAIRLSNLARQSRPEVILTPTIIERLKTYREVVLKKAAGKKPVYGINTGFGYLSDVIIEPKNLSKLQENLVRSHACGVGTPLPTEVARAMMILRLHTFAMGHSGISVEVFQLLLELLKRDIIPMIPSQGSVGASGDLAPLSHLALALIGEGEVFFKGKIVPTKEALRAEKLKPASLGPKEGLSLTNGTHFMAAYGATLVEKALVLARAADVVGAVSLDALKGSVRPFDARIHRLKPHQGQIDSAHNLRNLFEGGDEIVKSHEDCSRVQDPYSFRCMPQVHGAARESIRFANQIVDTELNSVTDNPLVFADESTISGGNFHGEAVAMALDVLAIGVAELASISEQRISKLVNPQMSALPAFLVKESGLNSGFMMAHVTAAALVSENKIHCHPASVDSIPTSANKEDHVSMGPAAACKGARVIQNSAIVLAIELLAACQGVDFHLPLKPAPMLAKIYNKIRAKYPVMNEDRSLRGEIESLATEILDGFIDNVCKEEGFKLE